MKVKTILVISVTILIMLCTYIFNDSFRKYINIYIAPYNYHWYETNVTEEIPLPPKTTLNYRTSETNAQYVTKLSLAKIKEFYAGMFAEIVYDETKRALCFQYGDSKIFIIFTKGCLYNFLNVSILH